MLRNDFIYPKAFIQQLIQFIQMEVNYYHTLI